MYYCCKKIGSCCDSICECCDSTCNSMCGCIQECCQGFFDCISKIFSSPFSFCTFISSCITFIPTIMMIIGVGQSSEVECQESQYKTSLIILGICNLVNFLFCIYLVCQYGKKYKGKNKDGHEEANILQRTKNLIMYDFVVCFYIFALIFNIVWLSISYDVYGKESSSSPCKDNKDNIMGQAFLYNLVALTIYLIGGAFVFFFTLLIYACDEGSCTIIECFSCWCLLFTCGCWDPCRHKKRQKKEENDSYRNQYRPQRTGWIQSSKNCLYSCGLFRSSDPQSQYHHHQPNRQQESQISDENERGCIQTLCGILCCCCLCNDSNSRKRHNQENQQKYVSKPQNNNDVIIQMNNQNQFQQQLPQQQQQIQQPYQGYQVNQNQYQPQQWQQQMQQPITMQNPQYIQFNPNQNQNNYNPQQNLQQNNYPPQFNQPNNQFQNQQQQPKQGFFDKMKDKVNNILK